MIKIIIFLILVLSMQGCFLIAEEEEVTTATDELNANTITLSPDPGTYESGLAVQFSKKTGGLGSGVISFKSPAQDSCYRAYPDYLDWDECYLINETTTVSYYLWNTAGQSDIKTATYTIQPKTKNITINSTEFTESETICMLRKQGTSYELEGRVKLLNSSYPNNIFYLFFEVNDTASIGTDLLISSSYDTGLEVVSTGDSVPLSAYDFRPGGYGSSGSCSVKLESFTLGRSANGKVSCNLTKSSSVSPIGTSLGIDSASWQCDKWTGF